MFFADCQTCEVPDQFRGDFFSIETGDEVNTLINVRYMQNEKYNGYCVSRYYTGVLLPSDPRCDVPE